MGGNERARRSAVDAAIATGGASVWDEMKVDLNKTERQSRAGVQCGTIMAVTHGEESSGESVGLRPVALIDRSITHQKDATVYGGQRARCGESKEVPVADSSQTPTVMIQKYVDAMGASQNILN